MIGGGGAGCKGVGDVNSTGWKRWCDVVENRHKNDFLKCGRTKKMWTDGRTKKDKINSHSVL